MIIIIIISIISITALVMACIAFSRTFKNNREGYSDNKQVKIAFHSNQLGRRGTEVSLFDYAYFNEKLLNNKSIIISDKNGNNDDEVIKKFKKHFPVYLYNDFKEVDEILKKENCDIFYIIKSGGNDGKISKVCKTVAHCVYGCHDPHGDVYSSISPWISGNGGKYPVVPHMINLPKYDQNMRNKLNIPKDSIVFGGYGGKGSFNIKFAQDAVYEVAKDNPNIYFVFANFEKFCPQLKNIIHLPKIIDLDKKVEFINTTDAMIHAQILGETFGLAVAEFSTKNKPVITTKSGNNNNHIKLLKDKAIIYTDKDNLKNIFLNFKRDDKDWNAYKDYTPEKVMKIFEKVYIKN